MSSKLRSWPLGDLCSDGWPRTAKQTRNQQRKGNDTGYSRSSAWSQTPGWLRHQPTSPSLPVCSITNMRLRYWTCSEILAIQGHIANDIHRKLGQTETSQSSSGERPNATEAVYCCFCFSSGVYEPLAAHVSHVSYIALHSQTSRAAILGKHVNNKGTLDSSQPCLRHQDRLF